MRMKSILLFALLSLTVTTASANPITRGEARRVAQELVGIDDDSVAQDEAAPVAPYYVFSRGAGRGFVIVSGDDSTAPIIGYTEQGDYDDTRLIEPLRQMLDAWGERLRQVQAHPQTVAKYRALRLRAVADYKSNWTTVAPLIETHWHQSSPYNDMAPLLDNGQHCATGCVATAGSQVAYYFRRDNPDSLQHDTPTYGYGVPVTVSLPAGTPLRWNQMPKSGHGTTAQDEAVATLMYALGASAGLTYGESTSGHNYRSGHWNMADALRSQLRLDYAYKGKWECSQRVWEELIYSNLKTRRPMLYSGVHPTSGGHSVVLDGYQASTGLFHFNFGWGGQGDGWYTVDAETGMNGFNDSQDLVYNFTPQQQKLSGKILGAALFHRAPSTVEVQVTNDGTLDYKGVYIFISNTKNMPTQVTVADAETELAMGETTTLTLSLTPQSASRTYVFLCGKNKQLLDSCSFDVTPTRADLHLEHLSADVSDETFEVNQMTFNYLNDTAAQVIATLRNGEEGTFCQPVFSCILERYNTETHEWTTDKTVQKKDEPFQPLETRQVNFAFERLTAGALYRVALSAEAQATGRYPILRDTPDSVLYFSPREATLALNVEGRHAVVTGRWNAALFAKAATDASVCSYDMTALTGLNCQPEAANANALFFVADDCDTEPLSHNVVKDSECQQLIVYSDQPFKAPQPFVAQKASFVVADAVAGQWLPTVVPFAAQIPYGVQAKEPVEWGTSVIDHQAVRTVSAITPLLLLTGRDEIIIEGEQVEVVVDAAATRFDECMVSTTVGTVVSEPTLLLGEYRSVLYYIPATESPVQVQPFSTYLLNAGDKRLGISNESLSDGYYKLLAAAINSTYATLAQSRYAPQSEVEILKAELQKAEDMLTYRTAEASADITAQRNALIQAQRAFEKIEAAGIDLVISDNDRGTPEGYYALDGQRLLQPRRGIVIVKQGSKARKMLIK